MKNQETGALISIHEAAKKLSAASLPLHEAEMMLARAIEDGELQANVKRWSSEQWEGKQLPGNLNRLETVMTSKELNAWLVAKGLAISLC